VSGRLERGLSRVLAPIRPAFAGVDLGSAVIAVVAAAVLVASHYHGNTGGYFRTFGHRLSGWPFEPLYDYLYWFVSSTVLFGVVPLLAVLLMPGERLRDYGVGLGNRRLGIGVAVAFYLVMLPVVLVASRTSTFAHTYPLDHDALRSPMFLLVYEIGYAMYFISWEWLFRGFLLFGMKKRIGNHAIWVTLIPFALMHTGKPELEAYGSIVAGVALAVLALRTRSFWYGAALHAAVACTMDVASAFGRLHR